MMKMDMLLFFSSFVDRERLLGHYQDQLRNEHPRYNLFNFKLRENLSHLPHNIIEDSSQGVR